MPAYSTQFFSLEKQLGNWLSYCLYIGHWLSILCFAARSDVKFSASVAGRRILFLEFLGIGVFEFEADAWAREIGLKEAIAGGQRSFEQHILDAHVIVKYSTWHTGRAAQQR